ncbi:integrase [Komagataeibacter xylinus NBRC 13693]|uniref:Integrase n=1 Tax=Komagataeibacter xylinus NBRC 13693 TaxID=1234668 RepID=A0A0D6Q787_KOMXY|nr:integrase [Komagataeibacter xylinus NBRC 13693]
MRQCTSLQLNRSGLYYRPMPESETNLELMRLIDAQFLGAPYYGSRQMTRHLCHLGHKRARRLMVRMGLRAIYQKLRTTVPYPFLLRDLVIERPNQV